MLPAVPFVLLALAAVALVIFGCRLVLAPAPIEGRPIDYLRDARYRVGGVLMALVGLALAVILAASAASAATIDALGTTVDLTEILTALGSLAITVLLVLASFAVRAFNAYLRHRTGLELDAETRRYLDAALNRAATYARLAVADIIRDRGPGIDVRSTLLAVAANYAIDAVPDALARFGIDDARLKQMIEARLIDLFGDLDLDLELTELAEPSTPPAPLPAQPAAA